MAFLIRQEVIILRQDLTHLQIPHKELIQPLNLQKLLDRLVPLAHLGRLAHLARLAHRQ